METPCAKSAPKKLVKVRPESAIPGSPTTTRVMEKDEVKEQLCDKSKTILKPPTKENTKPVDVKLHTEQRAVKRAMFNYTVATKLYLMERRRKHEEKIQKMIEEEEIKLLRKEMVPRAQLMPLFDRPFLPQRSNRPPTVPREPSFNKNCIYYTDGLYGFQQCHPIKPVK